MWEIVKSKVKELPMEWVKYGVIFFLGMTVVYCYLSLQQAGIALRNLQFQVQQQGDALNGQCQLVLERQGFDVTQKPPAPPPPEKGVEEKEDAQR